MRLDSGTLIASRARNDKVRQDKKSDQKLLFDYRGYGRVEAVLKERLHGGTLLTRYEEVKLSIQEASKALASPRHATAFRAGRLRMPETNPATWGSSVSSGMR